MLRPIVIDCNVMAESIRSDVVLVPIEGGGVEKPLSIFTKGRYLGSHVSVKVLILVYVRSKWPRVHTFDHGIAS